MQFLNIVTTTGQDLHYLSERSITQHGNVKNSEKNINLKLLSEIVQYLIYFVVFLRCEIRDFSLP